MLLIISICVVGLFTLANSVPSSMVHQDGITSGGMRSADSSYFLHQHPQYPRDCSEIFDKCGENCKDGVYLIKPVGSSEPFEVFCNNSIDGGGWTVFQRRLDGSVDFYRTWNEYKNGFGFLRREFWLGNDKIANLTNQKTYELRIDLNNINGEPFFAKYNLFRISDEGTKYRLVGIGDYDRTSTTTYSSMNDNHRNQSFSTRDQDNDVLSTANTAETRHGAWWFKDRKWSCHLNGLYDAGSANFKSISWHDLPGDNNYIKFSEMKIRPFSES